MSIFTKEAGVIYNNFDNNKWIYLSDNFKRQYLTTEQSPEVYKNLNKNVFKEFIKTDCHHYLLVELEHIVFHPKCDTSIFINLPSSSKPLPLNLTKRYTFAKGWQFKKILQKANTVKSIQLLDAINSRHTIGI
jgi:hypothetical protein